ncbi:right-handed parallel beta-helix repeat-containing protein [Runella zeae]|uniref:right-handed parallel beta-helix repeat-containing protein n=1 Tax=Runella zeae TaxID=94255 RepID=UPI0023576BB8|nr:right-handed parallel beta-helix repeat-containing protein [Runella zeae]
MPTTRSIAAGTGLNGGGDLSADRTLSVTPNTTNQRVNVSVGGTNVGTRKQLNFTGGVVASDDGVNDRINIAVAEATTTIATLRAASPTWLAITITDEGKQGLFVYNASSSASDNGATILKTANNRVYERVFSGPALVDWWKTNSSDNTTWANAMASGIKSFIASPRTYIFTDEVSVPTDVVIDFNNATIRQNTFDKACFVVASTKNVVIKNGLFEAGYTVAPTTSYNSVRNCAFFCENSSNLTFQNCHMRKWAANGITATNTRYVSVLDCDFSSNYKVFENDIHADIRFYPGSASNPSVHRIVGCRFLSNNNFGVHYSTAENLIVSDNIVLPCDSLLSPLAQGSVLKKEAFVDEYTVNDSLSRRLYQGNLIINLAESGIRAVGNSSSHRLGARVEILNNYIFNVGFSGSAKGGIVASNTLKYLRVSNNVVERYKGASNAAIYANIAGSADSTDFYSAEISGNKVLDSNYNGIEVIGHRITVSGNDIGNSKQHDIRWFSDKTYTQQDVVIEKNKVRRAIANFWTPVSVEATGGNAVRANSTIVIRDNTLENSYSRQAAGVQIQGAWPYVTGNIARNFDIGLYYNENFSGFVWRNIRVRDNVFERCQDAIGYNGGSIASNSIVVFGPNTFRLISRDLVRNQSSGANECGIVAFQQMPDGDISFQASSDPTVGTFQAGDRYYYPNPSTPALGKVYTGSSWVEF